MSLCEPVFIFLALPFLVILFNAVSPSFRRPPLLLVFSLAFYLAGLALDPPVSMLSAGAFPSVMLFSWVFAKIIERMRRGRKAVLAFAVAVLAGVLAVFKYYMPPVPPGMSFYIFTAISYLCDVSRGKSGAGSFTNYGAYFSFFPKLLSGPIARWGEVRWQLDGRSCSTEALAEGIRMFITGLASKIILADTLGRLWGSICAVGIESISTPLAWLGAAAFSLQLYFDFQGYSEMARGIAKMMGIDLPLNFDHPYMSHSVSEFWRRWHITLGAWFRDYVYIPLGGSRVGTAKLTRNLLIVWLLTGIWHGASVNFLLWGLMLFVLIAFEKLVIGDFLDRHRFIGHIYVLILMPISWMLFANTDLPTLAAYFERMFSFSGGLAGTDRYLSSYALSLSAGVLCATPLPSTVFDKFRKTVFGALIYGAMLAGSLYLLWLEGSGTFMYFSF